MFNNFWIIKTIRLIMLRRNILFTVLVFCIFLFSCESTRKTDDKAPAKVSEAQITEESISEETITKVEQSSPIAEPADVSSIDAIIKSLYDSITFSEGEGPYLDKFQSLFVSKALFIRINQDGIDRMDLESFVSSFRERIKSGALVSFVEEEISRTTNTFGSIAQIFSTYHKGISTEDPGAFTRGINSIQMYYDGRRWWISSILWEEEREGNPIPEKYLR